MRVKKDWQRLREKTVYTLGISGHGSPAVTRKSAINDLSMFSCGREINYMFACVYLPDSCVYAPISRVSEIEINAQVRLVCAHAHEEFKDTDGNVRAKTAAQSSHGEACEEFKATCRRRQSSLAPRERRGMFR